MHTTCERLIAEGRDFEGEIEAPLPSTAVWRGRDLALSYQKEKPLSPKWRYEETLAVNEDFLPCPLPGAWMRCRIDVHGTSHPSEEEWWEEEAGGPILVVQDFKSNYRARENELETIQRKIQAVVSWAHWGKGHDALRLVIVNFRLGREYDLTIYPHEPDGAAQLERWREDIRAEARARSAKGSDGKRRASPGACCGGCPYVGQCPAATSWLGSIYGYGTPAEMAHAYSAAIAIANSLEEPLRRATADSPILLPGGFVGSKIGMERRLRDDAHGALAQFWLDQVKPVSLEALRAMLPGLLKVMKVGTAQAQALLKAFLRTEKDQIEKRDQIFESITHRRIAPEWGVHKGAPPEVS